MALTGIEIYKHLPKTNCKKCGFPTCLAFAMKVSQKAIAITACTDLSEAGKAALEAASRPPIRLVTIGSDSRKVEVGNEVVMFRHEKTFYHPPGLMIKLTDTAPLESTLKTVDEVANLSIERVGLKLTLDGFAIQNESKDAATFARVTDAVKNRANLPLVLMSADPAAMDAALQKAAAGRPLIHAATGDNWEQMAGLAKKHSCPLVASEPASLDELSALTQKLNQAGVEDIVLDPGSQGFGASLNTLTQLRRLALKKSFRPLGYPIITFPADSTASPEEEVLLAGQQIAKYAGIIVLSRFSPATAYPLLTMRLNIYTDPQKPIQMSPGIYPIGAPKPGSPLCVTTNFSLTYFSVATELEASGFPSWLLVCDTEGLSVLTAWAAGKFDAEKIAKSVKAFNVEASVSHRNIIIPGRVAVLRGELEEELQGWKIMVGPPEAMEIGSYLKRYWTN